MAIDPNRNVTMAVQVLPMVDDLYSVVDRAIEVIASSAVKYEVCPMETVMQGPLDQLLEVAKAAHLSCFEAGAKRVVTVLKIGDQVHGTSIEATVGKYRKEA